MRRFSVETVAQAFSRGSRDEGIFPRQQRRRLCNDPLTIDLFCHGVHVRGFSALGFISANFLLTERKICAMIYQLIKYATVAQSVEQLIRNQQVAGSSPASSSTGTRFSQDNRVFCLQKRLENGVFPPLWPQSGLGQRLGQAHDPDLTQTWKETECAGDRQRRFPAGPFSVIARAPPPVAIRFFPSSRILRGIILFRGDPRADQAPHDGRCLVLGSRGGVGVGSQGEASVAVTQHGGDGLHVHAVL